MRLSIGTCQILFSRFGLFARQALEVSAAALVLQLLGMATALIWLRILPIEENAAFALCITTMGFVAMASDLGLTGSINFFWREAEHGRCNFNERFAAIRKLRKILFIIASLAGSLVLAKMLGTQGQPPFVQALLVILTLIASWFQINFGMRIAILRLCFAFRQGYFSDLVGSFLRLSMAGLATFFAFGKASIAIGGMALGSLATFAISGSANQYRDRFEGAHSKPSMGPIYKFVLPTMPSTILFAMQDPFIYWLATAQGGTQVVAQTFAIGRIAAIFLIVNSIMTNLIMPRIVNLRHERIAVNRGLLTVLLMALCCLLLFGAFAAIPAMGSLLMGAKYNNLHIELLFALGCSSFQLLAQSFGQLNRSMGWVRMEPIMIGFHVVAAIFLAQFSDFSTTLGVMRFSLILAILGFLEMAFISAVNWKNTAKTL